MSTLNNKHVKRLTKVKNSFNSTLLDDANVLTKNERNLNDSIEYMR